MSRSKNRRRKRALRQKRDKNDFEHKAQGGAVNIITVEEYNKKKEKKIKTEYEEYLSSPHWEKMKELIHERDGRRCKICDATGLMHVHHRSYKNTGNPELEPDDLVLLCAGCHRIFHKYSRVN